MMGAAWRGWFELRVWWSHERIEEVLTSIRIVFLLKMLKYLMLV
jgi:hypothetical protein